MTGQMPDLQEFATNAAPDVSKLEELGKLVSQMMNVRQEVDELKSLLSEKTAVLQSLQIGQVPDLMAELGLSEVKTTDGDRIVVSREVQCKFIPEVKHGAIKWLEQNGQGAIVKHQVSLTFGKDSEAITERAVSALKAAGFDPDVTEDVHHATLKAWGSRVVADGGNIPSEFFAVNVFSIAKVK